MNQSEGSEVPLTKQKRKRSTDEERIETAYSQTANSRIRKSYLLAASSLCFICQGETRSLDNRWQCCRCFKSFHDKCYQFPITESTSQCIYCALLDDFKCCECYQSITQSDLHITCQMCGNKTHFDCQAAHLRLILMASLYSRHFEDDTRPKGREFYQRLLQSVKQSEDEIKHKADKKEYYRLLIETTQKESEYIEEDSYSLAECLFSLCHLCKNRKSINTSLSLIYKSTFYQLFNYTANNSSDTHEFYFPSICRGTSELTGTPQKEHKAIDYGQSHLKRLHLKKIIDQFFIDSHQSYYLIKWTNNSYTLEHSEFISHYPKFPLVLSDYLKRSSSAMDLIAPSDSHFFSQLTSFKDTLNHESLPMNQFKQSNETINRLFFYINKEDSEQIREAAWLNLFKRLYTSVSKPNAKVLICIDQYDFKGYWKRTLKKSFPEIRVTYIHPISSLRHILFELIDLNFACEGAGFYFEEIEAKLKQPDTILPYLKQLKVNFNSLQSHVVIIQSVILSNLLIQSIVLSFKFNLICFDIEQESITEATKVIANLQKDYPLNRKSMIYFMSSCQVLAESLSQFLAVIYDPSKDKFLINSSLHLELKKRVLNQHIRYLLLEKCKGDFPNCFLSQYNWAFHLNPTIPKEAIDVSLLIIQLMKLYKTPLTMTLGEDVHCAIVNFIPIIFNHHHEIVYVNLVKDFKSKAFTSGKQSKKLIQSLNAFCSFPLSIDTKLLPDYIQGPLNQCTEISQEKLKAVEKLIKDIGEVIIVYSDHLCPSFALLSLSSEIEKAMGTTPMRAFKVNDEHLDLVLNSNDQLYICLFNVFLSEPYGIQFLKKVFNRRGTVVFQLFTMNSIEHNCVKVLYGRLEDFSMNESQSILDQMTKSELDDICYGNFPKRRQDSNEEGVIAPSAVKYCLTQESLEESDGIFVMSPSCVLFGINCDSVFNEKDAENDLDYLSSLDLMNRNESNDNNKANATSMEKNKKLTLLQTIPPGNKQVIKRVEGNKQMKLQQAVSTQLNWLETVNMVTTQPHIEEVINLLDDEEEEEQDRIRMSTIQALNSNSKPNQHQSIIEISANNVPISIGTLNTKVLINSSINNQHQQKENNSPNFKRKPLNECLKLISSSNKFSEDKLFQLNNLLLSKGFNYCIRKSLLLLIINNGIGLNELLAWTTKAQKHIASLYNKQFSPELLRIYIEFFLFFLFYRPDSTNEFLFFSYKPLVIKSQLLIVHYNKQRQESLIQSILDDNVLMTHCFYTSPQSKQFIFRIIKHVLDNCSISGFNKYENFFDLNNIVKSLNANAKDPHHSMTLTEVMNQMVERKHQSDFLEMIENLYIELFNRLYLTKKRAN